jgi:hypothetical protein
MSGIIRKEQDKIMNKKESPLDFFSSSKKPKEVPAPTPPTKKTFERTSQKATANDYSSVSKTEAAEMIQKMKEMQKELDDKMEILSKKTGVPKNEVLNLIHKYQNLSKEELANIEEDKKNFAAKIWQSIGRQVNPESPPATSAKRKTKTLGLRKKWIPIR